jgi:hypothetical protein
MSRSFGRGRRSFSSFGAAQAARRQPRNIARRKLRLGRVVVIAADGNCSPAKRFVPDVDWQPPWALLR